MVIPHIQQVGGGTTVELSTLVDHSITLMRIHWNTTLVEVLTFDMTPGILVQSIHARRMESADTVQLDHKSLSS